MKFLKRIGIDTYMLLLIGTVCLGLIVPAQGVPMEILGHVTYWAVSLLFFLYGAKLDPSSVKAGLMNWRLQGLTFLATYLVIPVIGLLMAFLFGPILGSTVTLGLIFLAVLPSTVQSSIAFTSIAGGNVPAAICAASLSNMIGVLLTPALIALFMHQSHDGVSFDAVVKIATQILLPFVIGQLVRPLLGAFLVKHKFLTMLVDRGSILLIVYKAFSASTTSGLWNTIPFASLLTLVVVILVFLALTMAAMTFGGRFFNLDAPDRAVLFYCGSTKSLASGLPIASALFAASQVGAIVLPIMIYHMSQLLVCAYISQKAAQRLTEATAEGRASA